MCDSPLNPASPPNKPTRLQRSCDICRKKKLRCDGPNCSNCSCIGSPCTYLLPTQNRGPKNMLVQALRKENAALRAQLRSQSLCSLCAQPRGYGPSKSASVFHHNPPESDTTAEPEEPPENNDMISDELASRFHQFGLSAKNKYYGPSGGFALANEAMAMKEKYLGRRIVSYPRRRLYWDILPWEKEAFSNRPQYIYPPGDLIASLIQLFFTNVHPTVPILHRPSFEHAVEHGLHFRDTEFGGVLLSLLAVASRYSEDPRVFVEGDTSLSSGWKFANQVQIVKKLFQPTLYEVQMYSLMSLFCLGTSLPQNSWVYMALASRFLQHRGEHRKKREHDNLNFEDELWKRAFWSFIVLDRMVSVFVGRPSAFLVDYDVDLPLEVDDEYWDHGFMQPLGKPSLMSYSVYYARLCEIVGDAMPRLYGSKKMKLELGWDGPEWERRTVAKFDSAMNDFFDSILPHLRWNPDSPQEGPFFDQAATLHVTYHYVQIIVGFTPVSIYLLRCLEIHRPYIQNHSALTGPSLSICLRAARTILQTAATWVAKANRIPLSNLTNPVCVSALILALNMFRTKRAGLATNLDKDLAHIGTALEIFKFAESRLQPAGRYWELLRELLSLDPLSGGLPPNDTLDSVDTGASEAQFASADRFLSNISVPELLCGNQIYEPSLQPGMSIDQLLASTYTGSLDTIFDNQLMSMWMDTGPL
ncbi:fungal-specific transcription factor domain-containing protein [Mycena alexandri]|uniref:Fungal-specific transcription factor domain-containing protein n=1 Tax=Mycena alexandri TaxID=1745969 RepID=A0AAD6SEN8_9AGAR|nr:fungal-specific transcription factor domain-containing protein [Mycena alexandri]